MSIIDNGAGIDAETLERATQPFFTTKGVGKGTGLGLSMAQGLAEQQGGRLRLFSAVDEGTTAELWLPVADVAKPSKAAAPTAAVDLAKEALTILAVDDDPLILMNTIIMLQDLGHTALEASSVAMALEILSTQAVDLAITDQAMPRMTGTDFAQIAREVSLPAIYTGDRLCRTALRRDHRSSAAGQTVRAGRAGSGHCPDHARRRQAMMAG